MCMDELFHIFLIFDSISVPWPKKDDVIWLNNHHNMLGVDSNMPRNRQQYRGSGPDCDHNLQLSMLDGPDVLVTCLRDLPGHHPRVHQLPPIHSCNAVHACGHLGLRKGGTHRDVRNVWYYHVCWVYLHILIR